MRKTEGTKSPFHKFQYLYILLIILSGCSIGKTAFSPQKKYSPQQLQHDYSIFKNILLESHPGLYWYTKPVKMNRYFEWGASQVKDSMTESEFRKVLSYVIAEINCGHTVVKPSKQYSRWLDTSRGKVFPLSLKLWNDTAAVAINLTRKDSILKRGTIIKTINKKNINDVTDTLFKYISSDGFNRTHKYQTLSNRGNFGSLYTSVYGLSDKYYVDYIDDTGETKSTAVPVYDPTLDSFNRASIRRLVRLSKKERKERVKHSVRSFRIDTATLGAFMDLNSFGKGYSLKNFFHRSFKTLRKNKVHSLIIDVRGNGGGNVTNSTLLSRYLVTHSFKVADSLYAKKRKSRYSRYIQNYFFNQLFMVFMTKKRSDGHYHFSYFEHHYFKPKKKNHFENKVYILTGGNSFSATTLFIHSVKDLPNVFIVGEETGGGAYGNTAWIIPDVKLPETKIRFRLPLFRLVIDKNIPKDGHGIEPEIEVKPTIEAIKKGSDFKMEKVLELIRNDSVTNHVFNKE